MAGKRTSKNLQKFYDFYRASYGRLGKCAASYNRGLKKEKNPVIRVFMEDLADLNTGGKMLRGMLVNLGYQIARRTAGKEMDVSPSDALALAFEMFQTGVLVHDDVIDKSGTRRGKYTIHQRFLHRMDVRGIQMPAQSEKPDHIANSAAICVGDLGIYLANRQIVDAYRSEPCLAEMLAYFDDVVIRTIRGELLDVVLPSELQDSARSEEEKKALLEKSVWDIYFMKTAAYSIIGPVHLGMILGGADEKEMKAMDRFAEELGIAYQIMDDILGIYADPEYLGKDVGSDIEEFKQTILYMYVHNMKPEYLPELEIYYGQKNINLKELAEVQRIFRESGALAYAQEMLALRFEQAEKRLGRMKFVDAEDKAILRGFIEYCKGRRK